MPVGYTIIKQLEAAISTIPGITVVFGADVTSLLWESEGLDRRVIGLTYTHENSTSPTIFHADAVILATGGMTYDRSGGSLLAEFAPALCTLPTTSGPHADGRGIRMARAIGAELVHMDRVQTHPTGLVHPKNPASLSKFLCPEAVRGSGAILVNGRGVRFTDELGSRSAVTKHIAQHCQDHDVRLESGREQKVAYVLLNQEVRTSF